MKLPEETHGPLSTRFRSHRATPPLVGLVAVLLLSSVLMMPSSASPNSPSRNTTSTKSSSVITTIKKTGVLPAATLTENAPWETLSPNGAPEGFDIDMVAALAKQLDVRVAWQIVDVAGRITSLQTGKVDIVAGDFTITPARAKVIGFSIPYILDPTQFLVKTSEGTLRTVANLNTPSVTYCTSAGGTAVTWVPQVLPRAKQLSLPTIPDCLEAINAGHAQVLTQEVFYNEQLIKAEPGKYRVIPNPSHPNMSLDFYKPTDIGLGLPHGDKVWASYVDSFLKKYEASSQITTSFKKWFGYPMPSTVRPTS